MRTLTVLLVVSLFFLVSFEAFASDRPVTKTGITPVEWTTALPVVVINAQSSLYLARSTLRERKSRGGAEVVDMDAEDRYSGRRR